MDIPNWTQKTRRWESYRRRAYQAESILHEHSWERSKLAYGELMNKEDTRRSKQSKKKIQGYEEFKRQMHTRRQGYKKIRIQEAEKIRIQEDKNTRSWEDEGSKKIREETKS